MLTELLSLVVLVALSAATLLLCFEKWGWLRAWEVFGPSWFRKCVFCAGWWCSLLLIVAAVAWLGVPWWWVVGAFPATALVRTVLNFSGE